MSNDANSLLKQAKSEARIDNFLRFFRRHKKYLLVLSYGILGLIAILFLINIYSKSAQTKYSTIFHQALIEEEKGNNVGAIDKLAEIFNAKFAPSGVKGLASLRYAGLLLNNGDNKKSLEIYQEIANGRRYDNYVRELASLLTAKVMIIDFSDDKDQQKAQIKQLEKLESKSKFLREYIAEQKGIYLLKAGELEKSYKCFEMIAKAPEGGQTLKARAGDLMKLVVAQGYTPNPTSTKK